MNGKQPSPVRRYWGLFGLTVGLLLLFVSAFLVWLMRPVSVQAAGGDLTAFTMKYPATTNSKLNACTLCHVTTSPVVLNAYGADYKSHGRNTAAFTAIQSLDSDGDGFTNLQEITAKTFPGSANDFPAGSPTATRTTAPTGAPTRTPTGVPGGKPPHPLYLPLVQSH
jgi:hypothetical protein